jgi:uncharacterized surface protein with fasciclin (FAS1) repeats
MRRLLASLLAGAMAVSLIAAPVSADEPSIADIAVGNADFETLVAALSCTDLVPVVADESANLTVFAPTDAAFGKLGLKPSNICKIPKRILTNILTYHVVGDELVSGEVLSMRRIKMVNGLYTFPSVRNGNAYLNLYAKITTVDIQASNGVIHVLNNVLIPYRLW